MTEPFLFQLFAESDRILEIGKPAHPHPETIRALNRLIPLLAEQKIDLVPISKLLPARTMTEEVALVTDE